MGDWYCFLRGFVESVMIRGVCLEGGELLVRSIEVSNIPRYLRVRKFEGGLMCNR